IPFLTGASCRSYLLTNYVKAQDSIGIMAVTIPLFSNYESKWSYNAKFQ
ncbi:4606_t:CDS:1, partial [Racocetra persica]